MLKEPSTEDEALPNLPNIPTGGVEAFSPKELFRYFHEAGGNVSRHPVVESKPEPYYATPALGSVAVEAVKTSNRAMAYHLRGKREAQSNNTSMTAVAAGDIAEQAEYDALRRRYQMETRLQAMVMPQTPPRQKSVDNNSQDNDQSGKKTDKDKKPSKRSRIG